MENKISEDVARLTVEVMEEEFGELPAEAIRNIIIDAIKRGNLTYDEEKQHVCYQLQKEVLLENGKNVGILRFWEPNLGEMKEITKGSKVFADAKGAVTLDVDFQRSSAVRMVTVFNGTPIGVIQKFKRRDIAVLEALASFFV